MNEPRIVTVICQRWEESEVGWGVRPDGWSLHLTKSDRDEFIKQYWNTMPPTAPAEYSRPSGQPRVVKVSLELAADIESKPHGIWWGQHKGSQWDDPLVS